MTGSQSPADEPPRGYVSEKSRRQFLLATRILGGLCLIFFLVPPMAVALILGAAGQRDIQDGIVMFSWLVVPPLLIAFILSLLMRRHRITTISVGSRRARFASITRRGIAQIIDAPMLIGPVIVGAMNTTISIVPFYGPPSRTWEEAFAHVLPGIVGLGISVVLLLAFSYTEGRWGLTPGKWLTGIRVRATNLQPCGLSYALVRNLLLVIDGFYLFLVGIMAVALSEKWQRVGDMAAHTVVVDVQASSPGE